MFLFTRSRAVIALAICTTAMLLTAPFAHAQVPSLQAQPGAKPPMLVGINDPSNPFHYTPKQQTLLYTLKIQFQQKATAVLNNGKLSQVQKQAEIAALQQDAFNDFKKSLTPQQESRQKAVQELRDATTLKYHAMQVQLANTFTPEQKQSVMQLQQASKSQADSITSGTASPQVKQQQLMALNSAFKQQLLGMLTPSQRGLLQKMQALRAAEPAEEAKLMATH